MVFKLFEKRFLSRMPHIALSEVDHTSVWCSPGRCGKAWTEPWRKPVLFDQQCDLTCLCVRSWSCSDSMGESQRALTFRSFSSYSHEWLISQSHSQVELLKPFQKPSLDHQHSVVQPKIPLYTQICFENTYNF